MPRLNARTAEPGRRAPLEVDGLVAGVAQERHEPMSAYDVVDILARRGQRVAAQQVYRSLRRLRKDGVVRRIESLNAYCAGSEDGRAILYCEICGAHLFLSVAPVSDELKELARSAAFDLERTVIELCGRCAKCSPADPAEGGQS